MDSLPREIWLEIFNLLDGQSLLSIEQVSTEFYHWLIEDELFWFNKCKRALKSVSYAKPLNVERHKSKAAWRDLYIRLISPYKYLLGCWQKLTSDEDSFDERNRGVVLYFSILPDLGLIYGHMSRYIAEELDHRLEGCVTIHSDGEFSSHESVEKYPFGVRKYEQLAEDSLPLPVDDHSSYLPHIYTREVIEFDGLTPSVPGIPEVPTRWLKLRPKSEFSDVILEPGLFTGRYMTFGFELLHVFHLPEHGRIIGTKILGDTLVRYGKHEFVVDASKPVYLSVSDQQSISRLQAASAAPQPGPVKGPQPFRVPEDLNVRETTLPFDSCLFRYAGQLTYAAAGYTNPAWTDIHYIQFTADQFAILSLDFKAIYLFKRELGTPY